MCQTCGCNAAPDDAEIVELMRDLMGANDQVAAHNRAHFDAHGVFAVNLMSSPGAGKTTLLEETIEALRGRCRIAVIEGDLETDNDAVRIRARGAPAVQITTGSVCHLDARAVHEALHRLPLAELDLVFIENVGNLVCPAGFDLGQHRNVTLLSVAEGDDKPAKYPVIFRVSDLVLLTKTDLLGVLDDFDPARALQALRNLGVDTPMLWTSSRREPAIEPWIDWLEAKLGAWRRIDAGASIFGGALPGTRQAAAATASSVATAPSGA